MIDFLVEEIAELSFKKSGAFAFYLLEREGCRASEILPELLKKFRAPIENFSFSGEKTGHGRVRQLISVRSRREPEDAKLKGLGYSLSFLGVTDRPFSPGMIREDRYEVAAGGLGDESVSSAVKEIETVKAAGYPNYFGELSFETFDADQGFFAEKLVKGQFNGALKIYVTSPRPEDKEETKKRKVALFENWRNRDACLQIAKTKFEKTVFFCLKRDPDGFLDLIRQMSENELSIYLSAYQAFIWNEILKGALKAKDFSYFENLKIPTVSSKARMPDSFLEGIFQDLLRERGVEQLMFSKIRIKSPFFRSVDRAAIVRPKDISFEVVEDETSPGHKKILLKFSLPISSGGEVFLKQIFA